jgi:uncharacterized protein with GYD domain
MLRPARSAFHVAARTLATSRSQPSRDRAFDKLAAESGVKVEGQYWTMGTYDGILILSADSEQKALRILTTLNGLGNVRTVTMQAFADKEFDAIAGK